MAKDKQSFILYCDILTTIEKLPNESAGKLFKHILNYVNDKTPELDDLLLEIAFEPIKQSLKRDLIKYEKAQETARLNGLKGGRPRNQTKPNKTQKTQPVISKPRKPVSVSVSVSDSVIVSEDQESTASAFAEFYLKYPLKKSKKKAEYYWNKLNNSERISAINGITNYNNSVKDKTYLKHPSTYLNQKVWLDGEDIKPALNPMTDPKNAKKVSEGYIWTEGYGWSL